MSEFYRYSYIRYVQRLVSIHHSSVQRKHKRKNNFNKQLVENDRAYERLFLFCSRWDPRLGPLIISAGGQNSCSTLSEFNPERLVCY